MPSALILFAFAMGAAAFTGPLAEGFLHGLKLVAVAVARRPMPIDARPHHAMNELRVRLARALAVSAGRLELPIEMEHAAVRGADDE